MLKMGCKPGKTEKQGQKTKNEIAGEICENPTSGNIFCASSEHQLTLWTSGAQGHIAKEWHIRALHPRSSIIWLPHHTVSRCCCITMTHHHQELSVCHCRKGYLHIRKTDIMIVIMGGKERSEKGRKDIRRGSMTYHHDVVHPIKNIRNISCRNFAW